MKTKNKTPKKIKGVNHEISSKKVENKKASEGRTTRIEIKGRKLKDEWLTSEVVDALATAEADSIFNNILGKDEAEMRKNAKSVIVDLAKQVSLLSGDNKRMKAKVDYYRSDKNLLRMLREKYNTYKGVVNNLNNMISFLSQTDQVEDIPVFKREISNEEFQKQVQSIFGKEVAVGAPSKKESDVEDLPWGSNELEENIVVPTMEERDGAEQIAKNIAIKIKGTTNKKVKKKNGDKAKKQK